MSTILQICVEGNRASVGRIAESLGVLALQNGWESYIAYGRFPRQSKSKLIRIGSNWEVFLHGLQTRFFDRQGLGSKRATVKLVRKIKDIKPDVIHLHHLHGYYINIEILFKYLSQASIPVIWTFHDCWSVTGHCCHFDYVGCEKWKSECHHCPQKREYPASYFIDRSRKNFNLKKELFNSVSNMMVVTVSNWLNGVVGESFMAKLPRQLIFNGIDINTFVPKLNQQEVRKKYNLGNRFVILGVANVWSKRKGLSDFIELSKYVGKDISILLLIGVKDSQIKRLPGNIIGIRRTENLQQLIELYSMADLFLNLSVEETFGLATAEALACGTPAVVYNATACPEVINVDTGIVVEKNNINGLLGAIETVKKNGKEFYSSACRSRAVNLFNKDDRFQEYINLYERMISNNS
jgi:glycosyltransferase involved in cell wall biosynthesis